MKLDFLNRFEFFAGIPDSQLKPLSSYLMERYGIDPKHHLLAANEGNCVALAAGYHLATGKVPVVYLQNSGIGNIVNPVTSLMNPKVYGIPCVFIIGWRGEPGVHDEPQHAFQGEITLKLLEDLDIEAFVIGKETTERETAAAMEAFTTLLDQGKQVAFVIRKGALVHENEAKYENGFTLCREKVLERIVESAGEDILVSTTGKTSRELFEIRERRGEGHGHDFLTVGSMGHSSSIALGIALQKPERKVWCLDGDGAVMMHMGAMGVIGACAPQNLVHVVFNNLAYESVGGMPVALGHADLLAIAKGLGYAQAARVTDMEGLDNAILDAKTNPGPYFLEIQTAIHSRKDLGRPTVMPQENMRNFMSELVSK